MSLAKVIGPDIEELIRENPAELPAAVANIHPADLAELLDDLPREDRLVLFEALPVEQGAAVLSELKGESLRLVLHAASPAKLGPMLDRLPADEVTDLLEHLTQRQRESIIAKMSPRDAAEVERLQRYPARTAGRLMTIKFATIRPEWTVAETLEHLKRIDPEVETVQSLYAVDDAGRLVGYVALRRLFPAPPDRKIADMMERRLLTVRADADQEEVARLVSKYDVHAIPVVDDDSKLLGIVTVDDVIDILIEEQTAGRPSPGRRLRHRGRGRAGVLRVEAVAQRPAPVQLAAVALRDRDAHGHRPAALRGRDREGRGALVLHPAPHRHRRQLRLADRDDHRPGSRGGRDPPARLLAGPRPRGRQRPRARHPARRRRASAVPCSGARRMPLALTVGVSILVICAWANTVGAMIPMLATVFKIDPTVMSAPLIATLVDATGLIIYFSIAKTFLGL